MNIISNFTLSRRCRLKSLGFVGLFVVMAGATQAQETPWAAAAATPTETVLYSFGGKAGDGKWPVAGLIKDTNGALYGTTRIGGAFDLGTVFRLSPPAKGKTQWTETVLYSFGGAPSDGKLPSFDGALVFGDQGQLFGTTATGGSHGGGVVFQLTPPALGGTQWTETILYNFGSTANDGARSNSGLILDESGRLYGTTESTVFKLTPGSNGRTPWTITFLYRFQNFADGIAPNSVIFDGRGGLYGTTKFGGTPGVGTAFQLIPPARGQTQWTKTIIYNFSQYLGPGASLLLDKRGVLYGSQEMGVVYRLTPPTVAGETQWTKTNLYVTSQPDFLLMDSYGALFAAGGNTDNPLAGGFAFKLTPPSAGQTQWTPTVLHRFGGGPGDGSYPKGGLVFGRNGALYGTTNRGGASSNSPQSGDGTIYQIQLP